MKKRWWIIEVKNVRLNITRILYTMPLLPLYLILTPILIITKGYDEAFRIVAHMDTIWLPEYIMSLIYAAVLISYFL